MRRESGLMGHQGPEKDTDWKRRGALARDGAENWQGPCAREGVHQGRVHRSGAAGRPPGGGNGPPCSLLPGESPGLRSRGAAVHSVAQSLR